MLSPEELSELEASLLPSLERHHLRLLAHSLRSLQAAAGRRSGPLPQRAELLAWALDQPELQADPGFCQAFLDQLQRAASQLARIAEETAEPNQSVETTKQATASPLGLGLADLVTWARQQADRRVANINPTEASP